MANCEKMEKCLFFNDKLASRPASAEMYKNAYCRGDKTKCARYRVSQAGAVVPMDLYPNQIEKAEAFLK